MSGPRNGKRQLAKTTKSSKKEASPISIRGSAKHCAAPFADNGGGAEAANLDGGVLDQLLADERADYGGETMCLSESPDKTLQRECMLALREPGLKLSLIHI